MCSSREIRRNQNITGSYVHIHYLTEKIHPLKIKSVVCLEGAVGYIYVDAFRRSHAKRKIYGMRLLLMKMVHVKEMPAEMSLYSWFGFNDSPQRVETLITLCN